MQDRIKAIISLIIVTALIFSGGLYFLEQPVSAADGEQLNLPPMKLPEKGNQKLDSRLNQLVSAQASKRVASFAQQSNIKMVGENVRVVVECPPDQIEAARNAASSLGVVETSYNNLLQMRVPVSQLTALADIPGVLLVRLPFHPSPAAVVSQGVTLIKADEWHTASYNGTGVKVGILDVGFAGYTTRQAEGELPAVVNFHWAPSLGGDPGTSVHGTGVAEIVHDVAPGAQLHLANFATEVEFGNAVEQAHRRWGEHHLLFGGLVQCRSR